MILAIDTSSVSGSIALVDDVGLVAERTVSDAGTHSQWLMRNISGVLDDSGVKLSEIRLFAMTIGPGSFTGLRIGVSTVKALAWAEGKKVAAVSTLEALALNLPRSHVPVCPVLDARKGEVYTALYDTSGGSAEAIVKDGALAPDSLFGLLREKGFHSGPVIFTGSGLGAYSEEIKGALKGAVLAPEPLWHIRASNVALIVKGRGLNGVDPGQLSPVYLRKSEAELKAGRPGADR